MMNITEGRLADELTYEGITMVTADFRYPIVSSGNSKADKRINSYYRHIAKTLMKKARNELLPDAVDEWKYSVENSYPFRPFEAVMKYTVTMNDGDILSLYYDNYEYTGGAHGVTKRFGDTWRASTGWFIELGDFFSRGVNYKRLLIENAIKTAARQIAEGTHQYFENYPKLIKKYYSPTKFYIEPDNVVIFYDQYAIAPGFEGTPVFEYQTEIIP
ncbi:Protein of unknown function [Sporobacter termitidis DSM 10068]|uniref:DUF3298 domain-containing protein n=1 Tax=Sporobacter termitidis DSM 10068 TaxID=1123282 RepID=A0A1M5TPD1_9FIRM|nr:DUF3298 and DUF4163 domain-containing protein [Sporobacter termitidis]SHH52486.1 Protein of unknown function [Sporobacter termitidis DSM 10068]